MLFDSLRQRIQKIHSLQSIDQVKSQLRDLEKDLGEIEKKLAEVIAAAIATNQDK